MKKLKQTILLLAATALVSSACKRKQEETVAPVIPNEALTTVVVVLKNTDPAFPSDRDTATWEQLLNPDGSPKPVDVSKANITLKANSVYSAQLYIYDKTQNPIFVVSDEIKVRQNYHSFFYQPLPTNQPLIIPFAAGDVYPAPIPTPVTGNVLNLSVNVTDYDTNTPPLKLGLESTFTTGAASNGWLRIVLRHQPNSKNGTYAPGSTDLDVGYVVTIN
jgi:hypothetical protein